jgi:hypothetical protein
LEDVVTAGSALLQLAGTVAAFRDMAPDALIAAVAAADGGTHRLTYGDLCDLALTLSASGGRLDRIGDWHARETGPAGTVGDYCRECGHRWPCDTRRMADGTYVDEEAS